MSGPRTTTGPAGLCCRWSDGIAPRGTVNKIKSTLSTTFDRHSLKTKANYSLIVLLLGDLVDLIQQLSDAQLQLSQFLLLGHVGVIDGMFTDLDVQMHSQLGSAEPGGAIRVHANYVLAGGVRCE